MLPIKRSIAALLIILTLNGYAQTQHILPRSLPEAEGVSSAGIARFVDAIAASKLEWHSFMLLRHGKVVAEGWWDPYKPGLRHSMYSVSKSFTSTAIGFAVAEKILTVNDTVITFFPNQLPDTVSTFLSHLTIKDLLIMSTGHDPEPTGAAIRGSKTWVATFLGTPLAYEPGSKFLYNTLSTYMLSAIIQKVTGQKLMDYLTPRLLEPLGISGDDWEVSPQGINAGGYGLRVKTEDMARFGQFYLQQGAWNGKQLLSPQWISEATTSKIDPMPSWVTPAGKDSSDWTQGYGYQFWRCRHNAYRADGLAGQFIIVMPDQDAVLAITAEVGNTQSELNLVWDYLLPALQNDRLSPDPKAATALQKQLKALALPLPVGNSSAVFAKNVSGKAFDIQPNEKHVKNVSFKFTGDQCQVTVTSDTASYALAYGAGKWLDGVTRKPGPYQVANLVGLLPFKVAAAYTWKDADTLELVMHYVETPHAETMICHFQGDNLTVEIINSKANSKKIELQGSRAK